MLNNVLGHISEHDSLKQKRNHQTLTTYIFQLSTTYESKEIQD